MKRYLALLMTLVVLLGLTACGGKKPAESTLPQTEPSTEATTIPTTEPTIVPTTEPVAKNSIGGVMLEGMTAEEAAVALTEAAASYQLNMTINGKDIVVSGADMGLALEDAALAAYLEAVNNGMEPAGGVFTYDAAALSELLAGQLNTAAKNATVSYNSSQKKFVAAEGSNGIQYDTDAAAAAAAEAIAMLNTQAEITVNTTELNPEFTVSSEKVKTALNKANGYLNVSLKYTYSPEGSETATETIGAATLAGFVSVSDKMEVSISKSAVESYASQMADRHNGSDYKGKFVTTSGTTISSTVTYYGQRVNKSALADDIYKCVTEQKSGTRTAPYNAKSSKPFGGSYVEIDLSAQKLWLYKDGERIVTTNLVSGSVAEGHRTPTGVYSIYAKQTDRYLSGEGYRSWVNYWMPFLGGYGLHDASWRSSFGGTIYHYNGSHGCVNLPSSAAKKIYNNVSVGTKVILYGGKTEVPDLEQKLTGTTSYTVTEGAKNFKLDVKAKYSDAKLTYVSSDTNVVTVSSNGTVTVVGAGTATITVKAEAFEFYTGAELKVTITVQPGSAAPTEPSEPAPTEPKPTEPAPTEPKPTEPAPTEPKPTEPAPTEPKPTEPVPTEPAPTEPAEETEE